MRSGAYYHDKTGSILHISYVGVRYCPDVSGIVEMYEIDTGKAEDLTVIDIPLDADEVDSSDFLFLGPI